MNDQFLNQVLHVLRRGPQDVRIIASNFVSSHPHAIPWLLFRVLIHPSLHGLEVYTPWLIVYGFGSVADTSGKVTIRNRLVAWPMLHLGQFGVEDGDVGGLLYVSDYKPMKTAATRHSLWRYAGHDCSCRGD